MKGNEVRKIAKNTYGKYIMCEQIVYRILSSWNTCLSHSWYAE